jgi:hypothetical protein
MAADTRIRSLGRAIVTASTIFALPAFGPLAVDAGADLGLVEDRSPGSDAWRGSETGAFRARVATEHRLVALRRHRAAVLAGLMVLLVACTAAPSSSSSASEAAASASGSVPPVTSSPTDVITQAPSPSVGVAAPSSPPLAAVVPPLDCTGDVTGGDIDYIPDASGGNRDLAAATRELRGVRWSDTVAVDGARSGVIRDGRGVFSGGWDQSTSGGWLMFQYQACVDDGVGLPPFGLRRDAVAEVVVDGGVRVRSLPTVDAASLKYEPLLVRGERVFVVDGPTQADGYDWYLVQALPGGDPGGPFGWVAAASRDGETWIDDVAETPCPSLPDDALQLSVTAEEVLLYCFGGSELAFELDANVYCLAADAVPIEPAWMGDGCEYLSGDACGSCGIPVAVEPQFGLLPGEELARWSFRGHFDDPAAASCRLVSPVAGDPVPELVVHRCRTTFVLTSLIRVGAASS